MQQTSQTEETRQFAQIMARIFGLPENLDLNTQLEILGHRPHPGWDEERLDEPMTLTITTVTGITVTEDGAVKITKLGHALVEESLEQLGNQDLAETIRDFADADKSRADMEEEITRLAKEIPDLCRFAEYEPALIEHTIKQAFPEDTAGKSVAILPIHREELGEVDDYELIVNGEPMREAVPTEFGQDIAAREEAVAQSQADIIIKNIRQDELRLKIADLRKALPSLKQKARHLLDGLDRAELARRLNGDFVGLALDDQNQPVVLVRRVVNEELTEVPEDTKLKLIARHLAGDKLSENVQTALGIKTAIRAVVKALSASKVAPKTKPAKR